MFDDGPLAGLTVTIDVDASVDPPGTVSVCASADADGQSGPGDQNHWHATYAAMSSASFECDPEYAWTHLNTTDVSYWRDEDGPLLRRLEERKP